MGKDEVTIMFYIDDKIIKYEKNEQYIECIQYLYRLWKKKSTEQVYLRICAEIWYILTFNQIDIYLENGEIEYLNKITKELYECLEMESNQLLVWGYMLSIRPDLFLNVNNNYLELEEIGKTYIELSEKKGNKLASLLLNKPQNKNQNLNLEDYFNKNSVVDEYFLEIFYM